MGLAAIRPAYLYELTDFGGLRSKLDRQGLSFIFSYFGDAFNNPFGGVKQGPGYDSRFAVIMAATSKSSPAGREQKSTPASTASSVINSAAPISTI
jgi:hypothetical protein